ncbi:hypothetical protein AVEN_215523-1 [Araneus ventricosus]|uniref:Uncharacterized protein n=1 Tax=Araneus ventricosus TaxID=182803 RepID=A0A4Y2BET0_ARAVE|nr:hypothetical protein AVEN_215523-1 [Araneus ventricosus]
MPICNPDRSHMSSREEGVTDGPPPHYHQNNKFYLDAILLNEWIRLRDFLEYAALSSDIAPLDWGYSKDKVYTMSHTTTAELRSVFEPRLHTDTNEIFRDVCVIISSIFRLHCVVSSAWIRMDVNLKRSVNEKIEEYL